LLGGLYGASIARSRLLLNQGLYYFGDLPLTTSIHLAKEREISNIQGMYESSLKSVEADLADARIENKELQNRLDYSQQELLLSKSKSETDKMYTEAEVAELRARYA
jgi:hypothetical protein